MLFLHHIYTGPLYLIILDHVLTTSPHSLPSSFLAWALHKLLKKKLFFGHEKQPFQLQQKMLSLQLATQLLYRQDESLYHTATKQKRSVVKVLSTLLCLPGFETQTQNEERPVRGYILQEGEEHENRERDRGRVREQGVREQQRLGLSQGTMTCEPS